MFRFTILLGIALASGTAFSEGKPVLETEQEVFAWKGLPVQKSLQVWKRTSYSNENTEPIERICHQGQFWHIRGLRCVPLQCKGGNQYRDAKTGQCIIGLLQTNNNNGHRIPKTVWRSNFYKSKNPVKYPLVRFRG